jgi:hypothetical protein
MLGLMVVKIGGTLPYLILSLDVNSLFVAQSDAGETKKRVAVSHRNSLFSFRNGRICLFLGRL